MNTFTCPKESRNIRLVSFTGAQKELPSVAPVYRQYQEERVRYVVRRGWFPAGHSSDEDVYDHSDSTVYCIATSGHGRFLAGMRLTRVNGIDACLSLRMLDSNGSMASRAESLLAADPAVCEALSGGLLFDLTRLVSDLDGRREGMAAATGSKCVVDLLAMAVRSSCVASRVTVWIFATHRPLLGFLDGMGIGYTVLQRGRVSAGDTEDTYFCLTRPDLVFDRLNAVAARGGAGIARRARLVEGIARSAMHEVIDIRD